MSTRRKIFAKYMSVERVLELLNMTEMKKLTAEWEKTARLSADDLIKLPALLRRYGNTIERNKAGKRFH